MEAACKTPLVDLLKSVPKDAMHDYAYFEDGLMFASQHIPYGKLCHEALSVIKNYETDLLESRQLYAEAKEKIDRLRAALADMQKKMGGIYIP